MRNRAIITTSGLVAALVLFAGDTPAAASNGHLLQAAGAVGSGMGGAGTAEASDPLTALTSNPALLIDFDGTWVEIGVEQLTASNAVESQVGPFAGRTEDAGDPSMVPAVGWLRHRPGSRLAVGGGMIGLAGVGVDYPQSSGNPLLAPQPIGFGRVYSRYEYLRVPLAVAWRVNPRLAVGATAFAGRVTFAASPAGFATPDCSLDGVCFFPDAAGDSAMAFGFQTGLAYAPTSRLRLGIAYTLRETTEELELESAAAHPGLPNYGSRRRLTLELSNPAVASLGASYRLTNRWRLAMDVKRIFYSDAAGFGNALGWRDIDVVAVGTEVNASERLVLRAGYNRSDSPITPAVSFLNVPSPAVFEQHLSVGAGYRLGNGIRLDLAVYRAFENRVSGPFLGAAGPVPGTEVTNEMTLDSVVLGITFSP